MMVSRLVKLFPGGCGAERRAEDRQSSQLLQTQHPWRWSSVSHLGETWEESKPAHIVVGIKVTRTLEVEPWRPVRCAWQEGALLGGTHCGMPQKDTY